MRTIYLALVISNTQSFDSNIQTFNVNTLSFVVTWKLAQPRMRIKNKGEKKAGILKFATTFRWIEFLCSKWL